MKVIEIVSEGKIREKGFCDIKTLIDLVHTTMPDMFSMTTSKHNWIRNADRLFEEFYESLRDALMQRPDLEHAIARRFQMDADRLREISQAKVQLQFSLGGR